MLTDVLVLALVLALCVAVAVLLSWAAPHWVDQLPPSSTTTTAAAAVGCDIPVDDPTTLESAYHTLQRSEVPPWRTRNPVLHA